MAGSEPMKYSIAEEKTRMQPRLKLRVQCDLPLIFLTTITAQAHPKVKTMIPTATKLFTMTLSVLQFLKLVLKVLSPVIQDRMRGPLAVSSTPKDVQTTPLSSRAVRVTPYSKYSRIITNSGPEKQIVQSTGEGRQNCASVNPQLQIASRTCRRLAQKVYWPVIATWGEGLSVNNSLQYSPRLFTMIRPKPRLKLAAVTEILCSAGKMKPKFQRMLASTQKMQAVLSLPIFYVALESFIYNHCMIQQ